jgi:hypothetical protein
MEMIHLPMWLQAKVKRCVKAHPDWTVKQISQWAGVKMVAVEQILQYGK